MSELQAVLLCGGGGTRMPELTDHVPKCMLPVAGLPMFWYPLNTIVKAGITDILLVFRESCEAEVRGLLSTDIFKFDSVSIEPVFLSRDLEDVGTADVIRQLAPRITRDIAIVSGDFVTDASLMPMIEQFRAYQANFSCFLSENCVSGPVPGPKMKRSKGRDLIAYCEKSKQVVFMASEEDFEKPVNSEPWITKFPNISLTSRLNDCHVYFFREPTLKLLLKHKKMSSLKVDFIPYLLEQQYNGAEDANIKCLAHIHQHENGTICAHANTLGAYFEVNKAIIKSLSRVSARLSCGQQFDFRATSVSATESRVDEKAKVAPGSVLKRSCIGDGCTLLEKARIQNSLLMDNVTVGKGASISGSILCPGVVVEDGADIVNCIVASGQKVGGKVQNEVIEADDDNGEWTTDC